jgi:hypothetical protein
MHCIRSDTNAQQAMPLGSTALDAPRNRACRAAASASGSERREAHGVRGHWRSDLVPSVSSVARTS